MGFEGRDEMVGKEQRKHVPGTVGAGNLEYGTCGAGILPVFQGALGNATSLCGHELMSVLTSHINEHRKGLPGFRLATPGLLIVK